MFSEDIWFLANWWLDQVQIRLSLPFHDKISESTRDFSWGSVLISSWTIASRELLQSEWQATPRFLVPKPLVSAFYWESNSYEDSYYKTWASDIRIWNIANFGTLVLRPHNDFHYKWSTIGKTFVCSFRICKQLWSFLSRRHIAWQHNTDTFWVSIANLFQLPLLCNVSFA